MSSRLLRRLILGLAVLIVVGLVGTTLLTATIARRPAPRTAGELRLDRLAAPVLVERDAHGIPQLTGESPKDLAMALGYVQAQDGFFVMDLRRRVASGTLAALIGPEGIESDKVARTFGWRRTAQKSLPLLDPRTRQVLTAYADGVNAYLAGRSPSAVSLDYTLLDADATAMTPWTPADSLAVLGYAAWSLSPGVEQELLRARLSLRLPTTQVAELFPAPTTTGAVLGRADWAPTVDTAPADGTLPPTAPPPGTDEMYAAAAAALAALPPLTGPNGPTSNAIAVSGARSATGSALLAADPHLAVSAPGLFSQFGLQCRTVGTSCPWQVTGFGIAGFPAVLFGHNADLAWSFSPSRADVADLRVERLKGGSWYSAGAWNDLEVRTETLGVAGGSDVSVEVRSTGHGPLLSDVLAADPPPATTRLALSLEWTGFGPDRTADGLLGLQEARSFGEFRAASRLVGAPATLYLVASIDGAIGAQLAGRIPVRGTRVGEPGAWPTSGQDPAADWQSSIRFDRLPWTGEPEDGLLVAADQPVATAAPTLPEQVAPGARADRIRSLLHTATPVDATDLARIQADTSDPVTKAALAQFAAVDLGRDEFTAQAQRLLATWDGSNDVGAGPQGPATAYANAVLRTLIRLVFDDELPNGVTAGDDAFWRSAALRVLSDPHSSWWDDQGTLGTVESRQDILRATLVKARLDLTSRLAKNPADWAYDRAHSVTLHRPMPPAVTPQGWRSDLFSVGPVALPGNPFTVDASGGGTDATVMWAATARMVVDLADPDASRWVVPTGTSAHPFTDHRTDQLRPWSTGGFVPWPFTADALRAAAQDELTLTPGPGG